MQVLFLDESGHSNFKKPDPDSPYFILGGIICERNYAKNEMESTLQEFKRKHLGTTDVILHASEIVAGKGPFGFLFDAEKRYQFFCDLSALVMRLRVTGIACAVDKVQASARYSRIPKDPYIWSLSPIIERFSFELGRLSQPGKIVFEKRDSPRQNSQVIRAVVDICENGTDYHPADQFKYIESMPVGLKKEGNIAGLQIADIMVYAISRHLNGRELKPISFEAMESKLQKDRFGEIEGFGLVRVP